MPLWVKDPYKLRSMLQWVADRAYQTAGEEGNLVKECSKAETTSLWYILMNKKGKLISLYEKEGERGAAVAGLLGRDFSVPRWANAAKNNAMQKLRPKKRYLLCASLFILGGDIPLALQVLRQSLEDPILAILACRML